MKVLHQIPTFNDNILDSDNADNAGVVVVTAAGVEVSAAKSFTLLLNQWLIIAFDIRLVKGLTLGAIAVQLNQKAGTATVLWQGVSIAVTAPIIQFPDVPASGTWMTIYTMFCQCSVAGTFTPRIIASSAGSDSNVGANEGRISVLQLR